MSDYTPDEVKKINSTLERIKEMYRKQDKPDREHLYRVFAEILEDPYYKENMTYYFRRFLTDKY